MDQTYTITQLGDAEQWQGNDGTLMCTYAVGFQGQHEYAHVTRPANAPGPRVGEEMTGTIGPKNQYGRRPFKKAKAQRSGGGGRSPEETASILRQHSQDMALRAIEIGATFGVIDRPADSRGLFLLIEQTTDWFVKDAGPKRQTPSQVAQNELERVTEKFGENGHESMPMGAQPDPEGVPF